MLFAVCHVKGYVVGLSVSEGLLVFLENCDLFCVVILKINLDCSV